MIHELLLSLGTNLGERHRHLDAALRALSRDLRISAVSGVYETPPWGETAQPPFLNCCVRAETEMAPLAVLDLIKEIERSLGRTPTYRWGPRTIDIDLLAYDDLTVDDRRLTLPHPHLAARAFVLVPLADIAPNWAHPLTGATVDQMLSALDRGGITLVEAAIPVPTTTEGEA